MNTWGECVRNTRLVAYALAAVGMVAMSTWADPPKPAEGVNYPALSVEKLTELAEGGDAIAQNRLGIRYALGQGVKMDMATANQWYRRAAEAGNPSAQNNLGKSYLHGTGLKVDYAEAFRWLTLAAKGGIAQAQNTLGTMYEKGIGTKTDMQQAAAWYRKAALQNDPSAQSNYAVCLLRGQGIPKNIAEGVAWLKKSVAQNDPQGLRNLGLVYENGWTGKKDLAKAADLYKHAIAAGNARALPKLQALSDAGNPAGQFHLATLLETGVGVKQDQAAARELYQKAADQNHTRAISVLGLFYEYGVGGPKDSEKAVKLLQTAADRGDAQAQNALAKCYYNGSGVEKDDAKAVAWFKKAAAQDYTEAINNVGYMIEHGLTETLADGKPDLDRAVALYAQAAERGHAIGVRNLRRLAVDENDAAKAAMQRLGIAPETIAQSDEPPTAKASPEKKPEQPDPQAAAETTSPTSSPVEELKGLVAKYEAKNFGEAIDGLQVFVEKYPRSDIAWNLLGMALKEKELPDQAEAAFDQAIALNPRALHPYLSKAALQENQNRYHEAAMTLEEAVEHHPSDERLLRTLCEMESRAKRYREVAQYGERAWQQKKTAPLAFKLAIAYHFLGKNEKRDKYQQQVRQLGGNDDQLATIIEKSQEIQRDKKKLLKWIQGIVKTDDNMDKAIEQSLRYLNYDPNAIELWAAVGMLYMKQKDYPRAVEMLRTANYLDSKNDSILLFSLAEALVENGKFDEAMTLYRKIMELYPQAPEVYSLAALLALKRNEPDQAVMLIGKAWELDSANPTTAMRMAMVYHYTGNHQKRDEFHKKAEELGKKPLDKLKQLYTENPYEASLYYGNPVVLQEMVDRVHRDSSVYVKDRVDVSSLLGKSALTKSEREKLEALGAMLEEQNWYLDQLQRQCRDYLKKYPKSYEAWNTLAMTLDKDPETLEEALQCCDRSIELNENFVSTYLLKASIALLMNKQELAVGCVKQALEKQPDLFDHGDPWTSSVLLQLGNYEGAAEICETLWAANKKSAWIPANLAIAYHHLGKTKKRDEYLEHARTLGYEDMETLDKMIAKEPTGSKAK